MLKINQKGEYFSCQTRLRGLWRVGCFGLGSRTRSAQRSGIPPSVSLRRNLVVSRCVVLLAAL